jgi:3-isopropylmalate/(R)-2-methylmalate dehydratase small subunit
LKRDRPIVQGNAMSRWIMRGRCRKFGHDVPLDGGFIPFRIAMARVTDPAELIPHLFSEVRPGFLETVKAGDIIVGGRNFCAGKPHVQGFIAVQALGVGMLCETMPFNSYRAAVSRAVTFMPGCDGILDMVAEDDLMEVDFATGKVSNLTRDTVHHFKPLDPSLRDIIAAGGSKGMIKAWWDRNGGTSAAV